MNLIRWVIKTVISYSCSLMPEWEVRYKLPSVVVAYQKKSGSVGNEFHCLYHCITMFYYSIITIESLYN